MTEQSLPRDGLYTAWKRFRGRPDEITLLEEIAGIDRNEAIKTAEEFRRELIKEESNANRNSQV